MPRCAGPSRSLRPRFRTTAIFLHANAFAPITSRPPPICGSLPFLDKTIVQQESARLQPDRLEARRHLAHHRGTTGRPVPYWVSRSAIQFNYATYEARFRRWAGVRDGDRMVSINGKPIVPITQGGPPFWRHNLAFNQLYVSAYHLSDTNLPIIVDRITKFAPRVIVAYVSAVHRIARYINEHGLAGTNPATGGARQLGDAVRLATQRSRSKHFVARSTTAIRSASPCVSSSECADGSMHAESRVRSDRVRRGRGGSRDRRDRPDKRCDADASISNRRHWHTGGRYRPAGVGEACRL